MVSLRRFVSTAVMRARRWTLVVRTRIWLPVNERAGNAALAQRHGQQRDRHLLAGGEQHVHFARIRFARDAGGEIDQPVGGSPMAETTTAMRSPRARTAATFSATRWMSSTEPTEVPPYFWTIVSCVRVLALTRRAWRARKLRRWRAPRRARPGCCRRPARSPGGRRPCRRPGPRRCRRARPPSPCRSGRQ